MTSSYEIPRSCVLLWRFLSLRGTQLPVFSKSWRLKIPADIHKTAVDRSIYFAIVFRQPILSMDGRLRQDVPFNSMMTLMRFESHFAQTRTSFRAWHKCPGRPRQFFWPTQKTKRYSCSSEILTGWQKRKSSFKRYTEVKKIREKEGI